MTSEYESNICYDAINNICRSYAPQNAKQINKTSNTKLSYEDVTHIHNTNEYVVKSRAVLIQIDGQMNIVHIET